MRYANVRREAGWSSGPNGELLEMSADESCGGDSDADRRRSASCRVSKSFSIDL